MTAITNASQLTNLKGIHQRLEEQSRRLEEQSRELEELRQAVVKFHGDGNKITRSVRPADSDLLTNRRGMLKTVAGLAAGIATAGMLWPNDSKGTPARKSFRPSATGGNMIIGQPNSPTNDGDVTSITNPGTVLFDNLFAVTNDGTTPFIQPANSKIALVAYSNNFGGTPTAGNQYALYAQANAPAGGTAIGIHTEGDDIGIEAMASNMMAIGVQAIGGPGGCGVDGSANGDANCFGVRGMSDMGLGGAFIGERAAIGLFMGTTAVPNPNDSVPTGATGDLYRGSTNGSLWYRTGAPSLYQRLADSTTAGALTVKAPPVRIIDTRTGSGFADAGNHYTNDTLRLYDIATLAALPTGARAVVARLTVVGATASGVIQASPNPPVSGNDLGPGTAVLNYPLASVIPSFGASFVTALNSSGQLRVRGFMAGGGTVDVIVDIVGYYL